jgi:hypothetical protein
MTRCVAAIAIFFRPFGVDIQAFCALLVVAVFTQVHVKANPYTEGALNRLDLYGLLAAFGTFYCGLFLYSDNTSDGVRSVMSVAIVGANIAFVVSWAVTMARALKDAGHVTKVAGMVLTVKDKMGRSKEVELHTVTNPMYATTEGLHAAPKRRGDPAPTGTQHGAVAASNANADATGAVQPSKRGVDSSGGAPRDAVAAGRVTSTSLVSNPMHAAPGTQLEGGAAVGERSFNRERMPDVPAAATADGADAQYRQAVAILGPTPRTTAVVGKRRHHPTGVGASLSHAPPHDG